MAFICSGKGCKATVESPRTWCHDCENAPALCKGGCGKPSDFGMRQGYCRECYIAPPDEDGPPGLLTTA